jgi:elongation factor G
MFPAPSTYLPIFRSIQPGSADDQARLTTALQEHADKLKNVRVDIDQESGFIFLRARSDTEIDGIIADAVASAAVPRIGAPQIAYLEMLARVAEIEYEHRRVSSPVSQYARVAFRFEPNQSPGIEFQNLTSEENVPAEYLPAVERGVRSVFGFGPVMGSPVTGVKAILTGGSHHPVESSPVAFEIAARAACRQLAGHMKLVEPIAAVTVNAPEIQVGLVIGDLNKRRGEILSVRVDDGVATIESRAPFANMFRYSADLRQLAGDEAGVRVILAGLDFVPVSPDTDPDVPAAAAMRA